MAWEARVERVTDGDTVRVRPVDPALIQDTEARGKGVIRIRLYGIDAPEGKGSRWQAQPYSRQATRFLQAMLPPGTVVSILDMGYDKYKRTVGGIIRLPDGKVVQEEMLRAGFAWVYPKYCPDCRQWKALEEQAKREKRGLWRGTGNTAPLPPWEWRKRSDTTLTIPLHPPTA